MLMIVWRFHIHFYENIEFSVTDSSAADGVSVSLGGDSALLTRKVMYKII